MLKLDRLAILFLAMFLVAGCATDGSGTGGESGADGVGGETSEDTSGVETGGLSDEEMMMKNPLEDPDSPLSQRIIYFEFDRSDIPQKYLDLLSKHAEYMIANPDMKVRLEGHADERGTREYNIGLGDRRAQSVRRILVFQGVDSDQVSTVSYGEERPQVEGSTEEAYAKNRRVEIVYLK
ncbi:MAG: peptidoglycan-associated lipoprotein Pal [Gammaproteobacteria bacterium]|nr:peptidoglycan-associated lipoprotein Pal [Gammaproteobacteria bacterium]